MNGSPDPLDSFPPLRVRESDGGDSDSELERYCSANSMMGTPSTSMSLCSAVTLFHDFSDFDFAEGLENLSLGKGTAETSRGGGGDRRRSLRYGSSGLELYGGCSDEFAITALDSSSEEVFVVNRTEESERNGERSVYESGGNGFELEFQKTEQQEQQQEREEEQEHEQEEELLSEGDDSMYNYGSDGNGDGGNGMYLSKSIGYYEEQEVGDENSLLMNSSVAFGSRDLDDFLMQSGNISVMSDIFRDPRGKNDRVREDGVNACSVSSKGSGRKEQEKDEKDMVRVSEVEETKDVGYSGDVEEGRDREVDVLNNLEESSPSVDCLNIVETQVQASDDLVSCHETSSVAMVDDVDLDLLAKEAVDLDVTDGASVEKENVNMEEAIVTSDACGVKLELDDSKRKLDRFSDGRFDTNSPNPSNHLGNVNAKSSESLEQIVLPLDSGVRKTLESTSTSTNLLEESPMVSKKVNSAFHCLSSCHFQLNHLQLIFANFVN